MAVETPPDQDELDLIASSRLSKDTNSGVERCRVRLCEYLNATPSGTVTLGNVTPAWIGSYLNHFSKTYHKQTLHKTCPPGSMQQQHSFIVRILDGIGRVGAWGLEQSTERGNPAKSQFVTDFLSGYKRRMFNSGYAITSAIPMSVSDLKELFDLKPNSRDLTDNARCFFSLCVQTGNRGDEVSRIRQSCLKLVSGGYELDFSHLDAGEMGDATLKRGIKQHKSACIGVKLVKPEPRLRAVCCVRLLTQLLERVHREGRQFIFGESISHSKPPSVTTWDARFKRLVAGTRFINHTIHGMRGGRAQKSRNDAGAAMALQVTPVIAKRYRDKTKQTRGS